MRRGQFDSVVDLHLPPMMSLNESFPDPRQLRPHKNDRTMMFLMRIITITITTMNPRLYLKVWRRVEERKQM